MRVPSSSDVVSVLRRWRRQVLLRVDRLLPSQDDHERIAQSASYWADSTTPNWATNSHWRDGFETAWGDICEDHRARVRSALRSAGESGPGAGTAPEFGRVLEWGSGGGANAAVFAPLSKEFVAVDISEPSLQECRRQVRRVTDVELVTVLIDSDRPEAVLETVDAGSIDLFLCFYVFELLPSEAYALRILRLSFELMAPGGMAEIQVKYRTQSRTTRSMSRSYERNLAHMTTFAIDEFWVAAEKVGYVPVGVQLVPVNQVDERYAYFALRKPAEPVRASQPPCDSSGSPRSRTTAEPGTRSRLRPAAAEQTGGASARPAARANVAPAHVGSRGDSPAQCSARPASGTLSEITRPQRVQQLGKDPAPQEPQVGHPGFPNVRRSQTVAEVVETKPDRRYRR